MVERIVLAGEAVLAEHGYQGMSTNRIAAEAGISPGSLYQYFADKDAIVQEISQRLVADFNEALTPVLRRTAAVQGEAELRAATEMVLEFLEARAQLLRALVDRIPPVERAAALREVRVRLHDGVYGLLVSGDPGISTAQAEVSSWMIAEASEHLAVRFVLDEPPISRDAFIDSLVRLIAAVGWNRSSRGRA